MEQVQVIVTTLIALFAYFIIYYMASKVYNRRLTSAHANSIAKRAKVRNKNTDIDIVLKYIRENAENGCTHTYIPKNKLSNPDAIYRELKKLGYSIDNTAKSTLLCVLW